MTYFTLFDGTQIKKGEEGKIIPSEEFATLMDAKEVLEKAKDDVQKLKAKYKKQAEEEKAIAKDEGHQEGLLELNKHIIWFEQQTREMQAALQSKVLPLALQAAKKIVGDNLRLNPEVIVDIVMQTLKPVIQNTEIKLLVSKEDKDLIEDNKDKIRSMLERVQTFTIEERSDITQGSCMIETETGIINATLENQWRALEAAFEAFMR
ncbi:MAG: hypothetical protein SP1CHLAM54_13110 [Chlamydiia bacterium]|nr:hypothetical protein [Chlamydiia bacterium]MCH9616207.1 hypothetical protein [Chlamydiia bacterium]MCH9629807.1 hypothetical protein [Chlamydiia bacterium]